MEKCVRILVQYKYTYMEDIACMLWECTHKWIKILTILMEQILSYKQCYLYNNSHIYDFLKLKNKWNKYGTEH